MALAEDSMDCEPQILEELVPSTEPSKKKLAEAKKEEGNELYKQKKYEDAIKLYAEAIELDGSNVAYYTNRAACLMMLGQYQTALEDCRQASKLDPTNAKGFLREAKCHLALGDPSAAMRSAQRLKELEPTNPALRRELKTIEILQHFLTEGDKAYESQDYNKVVYCMDRALQQAVGCTKIKLLKAESLALLKRLPEARLIANEVVHAEPTNADAMYVRGLCFYYEDNIDKALQHFQHVLRLAPDHTKAVSAFRTTRPTWVMVVQMELQLMPVEQPSTNHKNLEGKLLTIDEELHEKMTGMASLM